MPRYYFDFRDEKGLIFDEEGVALPNSIAAHRAAIEGARGLFGDACRSDDISEHEAIEIRDANGATIHKIFLRDLHS